MRRIFDLQIGDGKSIRLGERTTVIGVLNVTPDSFSDGGRHFDYQRAVGRALEMEAEGADVIEVGGESTRPGASRVPLEEEMRRVVPVIESLAGGVRAHVAVDTYKSEVARAAIGAGARIINDVSALRFDPLVADVVAASGAALVLMHMRGEPKTMQKIPPSDDIFAEIESDMKQAIEAAVGRGVSREQLMIDPGIGFGKTLDQNLAIINRLDRFATLELPLMIGTSRKSFIGRLTGRAEGERVFGTAASVAVAIMRGAHAIRVHDVKEMAEAARIADAIIAAT